MTDDIIAKGTCLPPSYFADEGSESDQFVLIPSWVAGGLFPLNNDCLSNSDGFDSSSYKRRKINRQQHGSSSKTEPQYVSLEKLIICEIRNCDVCGRHTLWTSSLQQSCFETSSEDDTSAPNRSIAESLPQFINRHISSQTAIPCSFCVNAHKSGQLKKPDLWCETLYCSKQCQSWGETDLTSSFNVESDHHKQPFNALFPSPKLFFCRNRISSCIKTTDNEDNKEVQEILESSSAIKQRFEGIGANSSDLSLDFQTIGMEECALLIATIMVCSCHRLVDELLNFYSKSNGTEILDVQPSEECLVEEMWVMSRSHSSLLQSICKSEPEFGTAETKFPPYYNFLQLYTITKRHCLVRVSPSPHPLLSYANKTLLSSKEMNDCDRGTALNVLQVPPVEITPSSVSNHVCDQGEKDSDIQKEITLWRRATNFSHWLSANSIEQHQDIQKNIHSWLQKPFYAFSPNAFKALKHSCAPTLLMTMSEGKLATKTEERYSNKLTWLALHDMVNGEESVSKIGSLDADVNSRSVELKSLMGTDFVCCCYRCQCENKLSTDSLTPRQLKRLGDVAMQQGRFEDAFSIYDALLNIDPCNADAFHAKAASVLGMASSTIYSKIGHCEGLFVKAQHLWNQATSNASFATHSDISVIIQKQNFYGTIRDLPRTCDLLGSGKSSSNQNYECTSYLNEKVFLTNDTTPIISHKECEKVIQSAENCARQTGWTTSRHYAVPTTDIPLHELTDLQSWFYNVWKNRIRPLLRHQFKLDCSTPKSRVRDIFIHDAFVVRYDANGGQRNLPPHYDESTHSFIIALNTDYEGGGTYIQALGKALKPNSSGGMISFCGGELLHSGDTVVRGIRYVIAAFCYVDLIDGMGEEREGDNETQEVKNQLLAQSPGFSFGFSL